MTFEALIETIPSYAKDMKLNFSSVSEPAGSQRAAVWGTVAACAIAPEMKT